MDISGMDEEELAPESKIGQQVCCECGVDIDPNVNPTSTCISCLRARVDITDGIARSGSVHRCRRCERYQTGVKAWMHMELESKELMELCMKKIKGLKRVTVSDAAWVWTEPHSRRLKVRLTVQKEVYNGAVLQQMVGVEFVVRNLQCLDCQQLFASMAWTASVQVRQRVEHKRTFFYLEQVILKTGAQNRAVKIEQFKDGLDFFFKDRSDALRFNSFLKQEVPTREKHTKKLVTSDLNSNVFTHQHTSYVEVAPACKDDLVLCSARTAQTLGALPRVLLVRAVNDVVRFVDPTSARLAELSADRYWRDEPVVMLTARQLQPFIVLDVEPRATAAPPTLVVGGASSEAPAAPAASGHSGKAPVRRHVRNKKKKLKQKQSGRTMEKDDPAEGENSSAEEDDEDPTASSKKRRRAATAAAVAPRTGPRVARGFVADVTLARKADLGVNDDQITVATHLGALLRAGDTVLGYDVRTANLASSADVADARATLPDVVLVRKAPAPRANEGAATAARHKRLWKLREMEVTDVDEGFHKDSKVAQQQRDADYELFLQQLETDKEMRSKIALFKIGEEEEKNARAAPSSSLTSVPPQPPAAEDGPPGVPDDEEEEEDDDDAPEDPDAIQLNELLDDIKIADDGDHKADADAIEDPEAPFESYEDEDI